MAPKCSREGGKDMPLMEADSPCVKWTSSCSLFTHNGTRIFQRKCPGRVGKANTTSLLAEEKSEVIRDADVMDFFSCVDLVEIVAFCRSKWWEIASFTIQAYFKLFQLITHWLCLANALSPTLPTDMLTRSGNQAKELLIGAVNSSTQCWSKKKKSGRAESSQVSCDCPSTGPFPRAPQYAGWSPAHFLCYLCLWLVQMWSTWPQCSKHQCYLSLWLALMRSAWPDQFSERLLDTAFTLS